MANDDAPIINATAMTAELSETAFHTKPNNPQPADPKIPRKIQKDLDTKIQQIQRSISICMPDVSRSKRDPRQRCGSPPDDWSVFTAPLHRSLVTGRCSFGTVSTGHNANNEPSHRRFTHPALTRSKRGGLGTRHDEAREPPRKGPPWVYVLYCMV